MTEHDRDARDPIPMAPERDQPLDPWMVQLARQVTDDVVVPNEMMWKRIQQRRAMVSRGVDSAATESGRSRGWMVRRVAAVAAVLAMGVAIGRFGLPSPNGTASRAAGDVAGAHTPALGVADPDTDREFSADALALSVSSDPVRVAMQEHLVRTVALLTAVRDRNPATGPGLDVGDWARELLGTTRLLEDDPSLRDEHTRQLLQDLELVLMQISQARSTSASEARRSPNDTMRETNLLPRVRAVVTASANRAARTDLGGSD